VTELVSTNAVKQVPILHKAVRPSPNYVEMQSWTHLARSGAAFLVTTLMVPAVIMIFFAFKGVWPEFRYCVFDFNIWAHSIARGHHSARFVVISSIKLALVIYAARLILRAVRDPALAFERGFLFLICGFYLSALYGLWALRTPQDYLPYHPLAFVFCAAALLAISHRLDTYNLAVTQILRRLPVPAFVALLFLAVSLGTKPFWKDTAKIETNLLRSVLTLTNPGDYVFDCKGETVFRQRCCRSVLETITLKRIRRRTIPENIARRCVETRTCVAVMGDRTPSDTRIFVRRNYLPVERNVVQSNYFPVDHELRVAGEFLKPAQPKSSRMDFNVVIPARYEIIAPDGHVTGLLDGTPYEGARFLEPGKHTFVQTSGGQNLALLWAQAADRHFTPFNRRPSSAGG
jgi:hypothetical protein